MQKKILNACAAVLALAAFALPAVASASPVLQEGGSTVPVGSEITGFSSNLVFSDTNGNALVECTKSHLEGVLTENSGTSIKGDITSATFTGGATEPPNEHCKSNIFGVQDTLVTTDESLPWCIESTTKDAWKLRGGTCTEPSRKLSFILHNTTVFGPVSCTYEAPEVVGTINTKQVQALSLSKQGFKGKENPASCPASGMLTGSFTLANPATGEDLLIN